MNFALNNNAKHSLIATEASKLAVGQSNFLAVDDMITIGVIIMKINTVLNIILSINLMMIKLISKIAFAYDLKKKC